MPRPPRLLRYLAYNCATGVAAGWIAGAALIALNVLGLGDLALDFEAEPLAALILLFFFGLTFAMVSMGVSVMALSETPGSVPGFVHRHYRRMADELKPGDFGPDG